MASLSWTIRALRSALADRSTTPTELAILALSHSNQNPGRNTYLWQDPAWTRAEAAAAQSMTSNFADVQCPLWGLPISVKDCFDLAGAPTSCGTNFYRDLNGEAKQDSWLVDRLRKAGAVITGKTHLHPLAYGITGENPEFGDCLIPGKPDSLTGGSSSGAAASILEGSAVAAIGTDTGGSIRVPASLCGLAGYRATLGRGNWRGGAHLAQSFDTMGWLFRDLEDAPLLAVPFAPATTAPITTFTRFGFVNDAFLADCDPEIVASFRAAIRELEALGLTSQPLEVPWWSESLDIFAPIQAWEAARLHHGHFEHFQTAIRERLEWGARITTDEIAALRQRHAQFCARINDLFAANELLLMPCAPVTRLTPGNQQSQIDTRMRLLRYTTPFSLVGVPVVAIPGSTGAVQLAAPQHHDESLLQLTVRIGASRRTDPRSKS